MKEIITNMDNVTFAEWDLNLFLPDEDVREDQDLYTVQPSAYIQYEDGRTTRFYLDSLALDLTETRMLKPDFPVDFWGADFFISLESFVNIAKTIPTRLNNFINDLPEIGSQAMYDRLDSNVEIEAPTLS
jgi:hypothetical protein